MNRSRQTPPRGETLLAADAAINLLLGAGLLGFPRGLVRALGIPEAASAFYPSVLGAVLIGIGGALLLERSGRARGIGGLGLAGAVAINLCAGLALAGWLVFGGLAVPLRGRLLLWGLVVLLVALSLAELTRTTRSREDGSDEGDPGSG